jgi:hypothetical protein
MISLEALADRYVARCPHGDVFDLALAHGLEIVHHAVDALLIDRVIYTNAFAPAFVMRANVALCCAFDAMRAARIERNDAIAEQIAALILERTEARKAA